MDNMRLLGVDHLAKKCYRELSGGQQQRVLLARALNATSKLLILDEPVTGLDIKACEDMYAAITEINRRGVAIIMVSHDSKNHLDLSSHVLHLAHKPKFFGKTKDYFESDAGISYLKGGRGAT